MSTKKVVFISGPITGVDRYWEPFEKAEDELTAQGFIALSPSRLPQGMTNDQYTRICQAMIDSADAVLFLPGYERSAGAMVEFYRTRYVGKPYGTSIKELEEVMNK
jgi:hypothetical protein